MAVNKEAYQNLVSELSSKNVRLVAVSKTKSVTEIRQLYDLGQRDFGENYVQELVEKEKHLPKDIRWHFIGHLQSNKVKQVAAFIHLIQSVDSLKLLREIDKQAEKNRRVINCLLQIHIAQEETKFGLDQQELHELMNELHQLKRVKVIGLMGMASLTDDLAKIRMEFRRLKNMFDKLSTIPPSLKLRRAGDYGLSTLSMGMTSDYKTAIEEGSNMVRIGSLIFGERS